MAFQAFRLLHLLLKFVAARSISLFKRWGSKMTMEIGSSMQLEARDIKNGGGVIFHR